MTDTQTMRANYEAAMLKLGHPENLFEGEEYAIGWRYYAPKANELFEAFQAAWTRKPAAQVAGYTHPDNKAVDRFVVEMKHKLAVARDKGRSGWDDELQCSMASLAQMLVEHVRKGDPVDIANFCMMLHQREKIAMEHHPCYGGDAVRFIREAANPATEPVYHGIEMAKVERDVELIGYGFLVDGRRVPLSRITWFNRPGECALPARVLPANVPVPWEHRVMRRIGNKYEIRSAKDAEIAEWRALAADRERT